jgi:DNA-binding winged helix-turn-helix (wHTH) protein/thioredoxin-like negative regulator of GroEL
MSGPGGESMLAAGEITFDPATRRIFRGESERKLSPKAAAVLLALAECPRQVWSRSALLERVWPAVNVGEEVLTHAVAELRRALNDNPRAPRFLETVHKSGYRLLVAFEPLERTGPARGAAGVELDAYADYLSARELYELGGRRIMTAAIELYDSVIQRSPSFGPAHSGLAAALAARAVFYRDETALARALQHCAAAHQAMGGSEEAFAAEGLILALKGSDARSAECFSAALVRDPESARTHYLLARAFTAKADYRRAALMFEQAARLRADDYRSLVMAGEARRNAGDAVGAKANLARALPRVDLALDVRPTDSHALCYKARCLWEAGREEEALVLLDAAMRDPDDPVHYNLASTLARTGAYELALDALEQTVEFGWRFAAHLERDTDFDGVRHSNRFARIAASIDAQS